MTTAQTEACSGRDVRDSAAAKIRAGVVSAEDGGVGGAGNGTCAPVGRYRCGPFRPTAHLTKDGPSSKIALEMQR
jgi:hypothetical protein